MSRYQVDKLLRDFGATGAGCAFSHDPSLRSMAISSMPRSANC